MSNQQATKGTAAKPHVIEIDCQDNGKRKNGTTKSYPKSCQHIKDRQKAGVPDTFQYDRSKASQASRRSAAIAKGNITRGKLPSDSLLDRDEYPMAMFNYRKDQGFQSGAWKTNIEHIPKSDNRGSGSFIRQAMKKKGVGDGEFVTIRVICGKSKGSKNGVDCKKEC